MSHMIINIKGRCCAKECSEQCQEFQQDEVEENICKNCLHEKFKHETIAVCNLVTGDLIAAHAAAGASSSVPPAASTTASSFPAVETTSSVSAASKTPSAAPTTIRTGHTSTSSGSGNSNPYRTVPSAERKSIFTSASTAGKKRQGDFPAVSSNKKGKSALEKLSTSGKKANVGGTSDKVCESDTHEEALVDLYIMQAGGGKKLPGSEAELAVWRSSGDYFPKLKLIPDRLKHILKMNPDCGEEFAEHHESYYFYLVAGNGSHMSSWTPTRYYHDRFPPEHFLATCARDKKAKLIVSPTCFAAHIGQFSSSSNIVVDLVSDDDTVETGAGTGADVASGCGSGSGAGVGFDFGSGDGYGSGYDASAGREGGSTTTTVGSSLTPRHTSHMLPFVTPAHQGQYLNVQPVQSDQQTSLNHYMLPQSTSSSSQPQQQYWRHTKQHAQAYSTPVQQQEQFQNHLWPYGSSTSSTSVAQMYPQQYQSQHLPHLNYKQYDFPVGQQGHPHQQQQQQQQHQTQNTSQHWTPLGHASFVDQRPPSGPFVLTSEQGLQAQPQAQLEHQVQPQAQQDQEVHAAAQQAQVETQRAHAETQAQVETQQALAAAQAQVETQQAQAAAQAQVETQQAQAAAQAQVETQRAHAAAQQAQVETQQAQAAVQAQVETQQAQAAAQAQVETQQAQAAVQAQVEAQQTQVAAQQAQQFPAQVGRGAPQTPTQRLSVQPRETNRRETAGVRRDDLYEFPSYKKKN